MSLGLLSVNEVKTLGLEFTVNESAGKSSKKLLGLLMARRLTCIPISTCARLIHLSNHETMDGQDITNRSQQRGSHKPS